MKTMIDPFDAFGAAAPTPAPTTAATAAAATATTSQYLRISPSVLGVTEPVPWREPNSLCKRLQVARPAPGSEEDDFAAREVERGAGRERGVVGGDEDDHAPEVGGRAHASEREGARLLRDPRSGVAAALPLLLREAVVHHRRLHRPGADGVDRDVVRR